LGNQNLSSADAFFIGENNGDYSGFSVSGGGDVNGDGYDDILIGAFGNNDGGTTAGKAYIILGPIYVHMDLIGADASFIGGSNDQTGDAVATAGDVNGDGYDDVLVGAYLDETGGSVAGITYLFYGPVLGDINVNIADASFIGNPGDFSGRAISGALDVDGDGYDDILIGVPKNDDGGNDAGKAYLIYGGCQ